MVSHQVCAAASYADGCRTRPAPAWRSERAVSGKVPAHKIMPVVLAALARTTGMILCAGTFPETARSLRHAGAGLVLHPSAYEAAAQTWWDTIYPAQALCNGQGWLAANQHRGA